MNLSRIRSWEERGVHIRKELEHALAGRENGKEVMYSCILC